MGYKSEQFMRIVDENLFCSICHEVFQDPVSCKDGHTFCSECIEQWLKTSKNCPLDNSEITDNKLVRNLIVSNIVDNLYVYCCAQENEKEIEIKPDKNGDGNEGDLKCGWTGKLQSLAKHRETCPFQQVQCPNVNCNTNMQRRELENHDKMCEYKELKCDEQCGVTLIRRDLPNHKRNDCPEVTLPCPNGCEASIKRKNITKHRETCPFQQVQCPNVNCNTNMQRRELEDHDKTCDHKLIECDECKELMFRFKLENHKMFDCPEQIVRCPNICRCEATGRLHKVKRMNIDDHLRNECAKTILDCPFKDQRCSVQVERQHVEKHVQDNMAAHMMLLAKQCSLLTKQNSSLTEQNTTITEKSTSLDEKSSFLTKQCLALTKKWESLDVQNTTLTEHSSTLTKQYSALRKKCELLDVQNTTLTEHSSTLAKQYSALTKKCESLDVQNKTLTEQSSTLSKQYSALTKKCESLTEQVTLLAKENKQLKEELIQVKNINLSRTYGWKISNCLKKDFRTTIRSPIFRSCGYGWYLKIILYVDELVSVHLFLDESNLGVLAHCKSISVQCRLTVKSHRSDTGDLILENRHVFWLSSGFRHWSKGKVENNGKAAFTHKQFPTRHSLLQNESSSLVSGSRGHSFSCSCTAAYSSRKK